MEALGVLSPVHRYLGTLGSLHGDETLVGWVSDKVGFQLGMGSRWGWDLGEDETKGDGWQWEQGEEIWAPGGDGTLGWRWWWTQDEMSLGPVPLGQMHLWIAPGGQGSGKVTSGPVPVDGGVKSRSLRVQGHDLQAGDRAAPPHSRPYLCLRLWSQGERELACPNAHCSASWPGPPP